MNSPRLVAVSNRVVAPSAGVSAGGLAVALIEALRATGGLWFGWSGNLRSKPRIRVQRPDGEQVTLATIDLPPNDFEDYYNGFANRCLWPLVHFRIDLILYAQRYLDAYRRVNAHFAARLHPLLQADDLIWVHDYHLFPLGAELRTLGARQRIGFFLHTPFPPSDLLRTLPHHEWLIQCLLEYDLVGFQTEPDLHRFHDYIERVAGGTVQGERVSAFGRTVRAGAFPIGIDAREFHELAFSTAGERVYQRTRQALLGRDQIIGVDRLDYTKGLLRRMSAFESLLERHTGAQGQVEFLQIAPISRGEVRAYNEFRVQLEQAAAHINGRFARLDWTPVRYLNHALPRSTLAALFRASRVGLVTPMRDGMNLVAKEYVAAQDPEDPGVLVLSSFAGAAQQMSAALIVNPYDTEEVADKMQIARLMPLEERRRRHTELMRGLSEQDVFAWRDAFVGALRQDGTAATTSPGGRRDVARV